MNEQLDYLRIFQKQLISFNKALRQSLHDLQKSHDHVAPMWRDDMRKDYDRQWKSFKQMLENYDKREGPRYVEFLSIKIHALERYLSGR